MFTFFLIRFFLVAVEFLYEAKAITLYTPILLQLECKTDDGQSHHQDTEGTV